LQPLYRGVFVSTGALIHHITVIGGGSTYTPGIASGFLNRLDSLPISVLWLMNIVFVN